MENEKINYYKELIQKLIPSYIVNYELNLDENQKFYITLHDNNVTYNKAKKYFNDLFDMLTLTDENGNELFKGSNALLISTSKQIPECENNNYITPINHQTDNTKQNNFYYTVNTNVCKLQHYLPVFFQKNFFDFKNKKSDTRIMGYYKFFIENNKYEFEKEVFTNKNLTIKKYINKKTSRQKLNSIGCYKNLFFNEDNCYLDNIITKKEIHECLISEKINKYIDQHKHNKVISEENSPLALDTVNNLMFSLYFRSVYRFNQIKEEIKTHLSDENFLNSININNPIFKRKLHEALLTDVNSVSKKIYNSYVKKNLEIKIENANLTFQHMRSEKQRFILSENVVFPLTTNNEIKCQLSDKEDLKGLFLIFKKNTLIYVGQKLEDKQFKDIFKNMNNFILKYASDFIAVDKTIKQKQQKTINELYDDDENMELNNNEAKKICQKYRLQKGSLEVNRDIKILDDDFIKELIIEQANNIKELHQIEIDKENQKQFKNDENKIKIKRKVNFYLNKNKKNNLTNKNKIKNNL